MSGVVEDNPSIIGSVAAWQNILNGCGYNPVLVITGQTNSTTVATTRKFQSKVGLPQTGEVTLDTWQAGLKHSKLPGWSNITPKIQSASESVLVSIDQIQELAPRAENNYLEAFQNGQNVLDRYGISTTPLRVAHFVAQIMHECGRLTIQFEDLNYSAERLPEVWSVFKPGGELDPSEYAHNPEKLANEIYGGRMGNTDLGDGFKYRGRGLLQLTGKQSYDEASSILRKSNSLAPDFVANPDEVISAEWCLEVAASEWASKDCNALADRDDIQAITRAINGGETGLDERIEWASETKLIWL